MILERIVLHDFCAFKGRHTFELSNGGAPRRPIVLFGGLNGSGKTTILSAIQLALYGKFSRPVAAAGGSYDDYLAGCVHHSVSPQDGAGLELTFRRVEEGRETSYRLIRSWRKRGQNARENVSLFRDDLPDPALAESWYEQVEQLLPSAISGLLFFDGEEIKQLADNDDMSDSVRAAVRSLLGLDLIDRLQADLAVLETRKRKDLLSEDARAEVAALERASGELEERRRELVQRRAHLQTQVDAREQEVRRAERTLRQEGGDLAAKRDAIQESLDAVERDLGAVKAEMVEIASGPLPLLSVPHLLHEVSAQHARERQSAIVRDTLAVLKSRDDSIVEFLGAEAGATKELMRKVKGFLVKDRDGRGKAVGLAKPYLELSVAAADRLRILFDDTLPAATAKIQGLVERHSSLQERRRILSDQMAQAPAGDAVKAIFAQYEEASGRFAQAKIDLGAVDASLEEVGRQRAIVEAKLQHTLEARGRQRVADAEARRTLDHAGRVARTLDAFRSSAVQKKLRRLEVNVLESFQYLLRKPDLVRDLKIDPSTFAIRLIGDDGRSIRKDRLSAGEKQILAISLLWGLARSSSRLLPVAIDTPLGRLDSVHRANLVEKYFPKAAHQVVLFSTDTEIDRPHLESLRSHIGRAYHLQYRRETESVEVSEGYFW